MLASRRFSPAEDGHETVVEGVEFYQEVAEMLGGFVAEEIAPHVEAIDEQGIVSNVQIPVVTIVMFSMIRVERHAPVRQPTLPADHAARRAPAPLPFGPRARRPQGRRRD